MTITVQSTSRGNSLVGLGSRRARRLPLQFKQKLERSVTAMTDESKRQHEDVMVALKSVRVYRKTLNQDQMKA